MSRYIGASGRDGLFRLVVPHRGEPRASKRLHQPVANDHLLAGVVVAVGAVDEVALHIVPSQRLDQAGEQVLTIGRVDVDGDLVGFRGLLVGGVGIHVDVAVSVDRDMAERWPRLGPIDL